MTAKWVGADDAEYVAFGGAFISTDGSSYRSAFADCALSGLDGGQFYQSFKAYSETDFWFSARLSTGFYTNNIGTMLLQFLDSSNLPRLQILGTGGYGWKVQKITALGTATDIGNAIFFPLTRENGIGDKVDVHINYDAAGSVDIYVNLIHAFAFVGDCTTDGVSALAHHRLGGNGQGPTYWSETWIDDEDTRAQSLKSWRPLAAGHANTFGTLSTGGAPSASNINEIALDVGSLNASDTAGQIDQYTNSAAPSETLDIKDVIISAFVQRGTSGPTKLALGVRTGSTDYWGTDQALDIAWTNIQEVFSQNPNTSAEWLKNQIGAASGFNIGAKSAA